MAKKSKPVIGQGVLDEVYKTMGVLLGLSSVLRFSNTPYMTEAFAAGYKNPVGGHVSECLQLWYLMRAVMPRLAQAVDSNRVYDLLVNHDDGEVYHGDVTLFAQTNGTDAQKDAEMLAFQAIFAGLPPHIYGQIIRDYRDFEDPRPNDLEAHLARLVDSLVGNFVVLLKGDDLRPHSAKTVQILELRVIPRGQVLIEILEQRGKEEAVAEVQELMVNHLRRYRKRGVDIDDSVFLRQ